MEKDHNNKIVFLGFCNGAIPVVSEIAFDITGCRNFDIVKNTELKPPEHPYQRQDFNFCLIDDNKYDFDVFRQYHFGVLDSHIKYILYNYFLKKHGVEKSSYLNLLHPSSYFAGSSENAEGFLLEPLCVVSSFCNIGFGVSIKRSASIGHHAEIEDFVSINPGVTISGNVTIGGGTTIGSGATIIHSVSIGKESLIGAGSVVTRNIPDGVIAYGNPCKVIRPNEIWGKAKERLHSLLDTNISNQAE